jgi:acyl carrier protein
MNNQILDPDTVVALVNTHITELGGRATVDSTFETLQVDSIIYVEMAVLLGQHFDVRLEEDEVISAGAFPELARLITDKRAAA